MEHLKLFTILITLITIHISCINPIDKNIEVKVKPKQGLDTTLSDSSDKINTHYKSANLIKEPYREINYTINENLNNQDVSIDINFFLDTIKYSNENIAVKPRKINVLTKPRKLFPPYLTTEIEGIVKRREQYNDYRDLNNKNIVNQKKFKLITADVNYDGFDDFYFPCRNFQSRNSIYILYVYNPNQNRYIRVDDFHKKSFSRLILDQNKRYTILYSGYSASEGIYSYYNINELGNMEIDFSEVVNLRSDKMYKIINRYNEENILIDTVKLNEQDLEKYQ